MIASRLRIFLIIKNVVTLIRTADRTDTTTAMIMVVLLELLIGVIVAGWYGEPSVLIILTITVEETIAPNDPKSILDGAADCTLLAIAWS
jgi:hypothetical protein